MRRFCSPVDPELTISILEGIVHVKGVTDEITVVDPAAVGIIPPEDDTDFVVIVDDIVADNHAGHNNAGILGADLDPQVALMDKVALDNDIRTPVDVDARPVTAPVTGPGPVDMVAAADSISGNAVVAGPALAPDKIYADVVHVMDGIVGDLEAVDIAVENQGLALGWIAVVDQVSVYDDIGDGDGIGARDQYPHGVRASEVADSIVHDPDVVPPPFYPDAGTVGETVGVGEFESGDREITLILDGDHVCVGIGINHHRLPSPGLEGDISSRGRSAPGEGKSLGVGTVHDGNGITRLGDIKSILNAGVVASGRGNDYLSGEDRQADRNQPHGEQQSSDAYECSHDSTPGVYRQV